MKKNICILSLCMILFFGLVMSYKKINAINDLEVGIDSNFVSTNIVSNDQSGTLYSDGIFSFYSNGPYVTIQENLYAGYNVNITDGTGDLTLDASQSISGLLTIDNKNNPIRIINGKFTNSVNLWNTSVTFVSTEIATNNGYPILINNNVNLFIDSNSHIVATGTVSSAISVNPNMSNVNIEVDGLVDSEMQIIGVNANAVVNSIIIRGKLSVTTGSNYAIVATDRGRIDNVEFTSSSVVDGINSTVVYGVYNEAQIGNVLLDGNYNAGSIVRVGSTGYSPKIDNITYKANAIIYDGAFYIRGTSKDVNLDINSSIDQKKSNFAILYTSNTSNILSFNVYGTIKSNYIIGDTNANSYIKSVIIDPKAIDTNDVVTNHNLFWLAGRIDDLQLSKNVFEVSDISTLFNQQATSIINNLKIINSIVDAQQYNINGQIFNNKPLSKINSLNLDDTLLFGDAINVTVANTALNHIEPIINTSTNVVNDKLYLNVELPEISSLINIKNNGVKLTFMFEDYTTQEEFIYYGGSQSIEVPASILNKNSKFYIVNYATYNTSDTTILTSNRSQLFNLQTFKLSFDINGGDSIAIADQFLYPNTLAQRVIDPTKAGFDFKGWNTKADGSGVTWDFDVNTIGNSDLVLYAMWQKKVNPINKFVVSFNLNGGTSTYISNQIVEVNKKITKPSVPSKKGYKFIGWNTKVNGSGIYWNFDKNLMPSNDLVLYATWEKEMIPIPSGGSNEIMLTTLFTLLSITFGVIAYKKN